MTEKMEKRSVKEIIFRAIILCVGLIIAHLGVTLFLLADLGADPFNVLVQGLFRTISKVPFLSFMTHGNTHICICLLIIFVLLVVDRKYVKIGTLICMIFGGPIIDFFTMLINPVFNAESHIAIRIISLAVGCIVLAYGMTIVIKSDSGTGPNDLVSVVLSERLHKNFSIVRVIVDVLFIVVGFVLGGKFGAGTLICACLVGPVAGIFLPINQRIIEAVVKRMIKK